MQFDKIWWEQFRQEEVVSILEMTAGKCSDYTGQIPESEGFL